MSNREYVSSHWGVATGDVVLKSFAIALAVVAAGSLLPGVATARCRSTALKELLATAPAAQPGEPRPPITPLPKNLRTDCPEVLRAYWQNTGVTSVDVDTGQLVGHPSSVGWTEARFTGGNSTIQHSAPTKKGRQFCVSATQVTPDFQAQPLAYRLDWQPNYTLPQSCEDARAKWILDTENHEAVHYKDALNLAQAANTIWPTSPPSLKYCAPTEALAIEGLQAEFQAAVLNYGECFREAYEKRVVAFHRTPAGAAPLPSPDPALCRCPSCERCCNGRCAAVQCSECSECQDNICVSDAVCRSTCHLSSPCDLDCPPLFGTGSLTVGQVRTTNVFCACSPCCPGCSSPACGEPYTLVQSNPEVVGMSLFPSGPFVGALDVPVTVVDGVTQIPTVYYMGLSSGTSKQLMDWWWCDHIYNWIVEDCQ